MGASQVPQVTLTDVNGNPVTVTGGSLSTTGGGGGGGAMTVADGADVAQGTTTDAEATGNGTVIAILKRIRTQVTAILAKQPALGVAGTASTDVITVQGIASAVAQPVSGTVTATGPLTDTQLRATAVPVSSTTLATAAKQPALGTAGTASTDVISVQGIAGATAIVADGSAARRGTLTDRSTTVTAGGTAQQLIASNASRKYLFIRNPVTATERLWIDFTTTAVADSPSIALDPGDVFVMEGSYVSTEAISVLGATTGHKITAKEG